MRKTGPEALRRIIGNRRYATDAAARELLKQLVELREYTPLSMDDEALVAMLVRRADETQRDR